MQKVLPVRYRYLDLLKFLAMFLICSYHFPWRPFGGFDWPLPLGAAVYRLYSTLATSGAPLFFMVNGALVLNRPFEFKSYFKRQLLLVAQLFAWRFISILLLGLYHRINVLADIRELFVYMLLFNHPKFTLNYFWFIVCLIAVNLLLPFIKKEFDNFVSSPAKNRTIWLLLGTLLLFHFLPFALNTICLIFPATRSIRFDTMMSFVPFYSLAASMLAYYLLGAILHSQQHLLKKIPIWLSFITYSIGLSGLFLTWIIREKSGIPFDSVFDGYSTLSGIIMAVSLFFFFCRIEPWLQKNGILQTILARLSALVGSNTLSVYYLHPILHYTLMATLSTIITQRNLVLDVFFALATVIGLAMVGAVLKKVPFIKWMFG